VAAVDIIAVVAAVTFAAVARLYLLPDPLRTKVISNQPMAGEVEEAREALSLNAAVKDFGTFLPNVPIRKLRRRRVPSLRKTCFCWMRGNLLVLPKN
jgi:hypothetical protein